MERLRRQLWKLTLPIFVEVALVMLVGAVDVFMLSSCGDDVVGAVGALLLGIVHTRVHIRRFPLKWFVPFPWREFRNLFRVGFPAMGEELSYCLSQVAITFFITRISTDALTTRTYVMNLVMFVFLFCVSVTQGVDILVGHLVGKERYQPAYYLGNIFACGTLRAAADPVYPLVVGIIFQWGVAVGIAWILALPLGWGLIGAWVAFALDENLRGIILMRRWHTQGWVGKSLSRK